MEVTISDYPDGPMYNSGRLASIAISDDDVYSLDKTLAMIIAPSLRKFKDACHLHPCNLTKDQWHSTLQTMIRAFELARRDLNDFTDEEIQIMDQGFFLFGRHFRDLWL